MARIGVSVGDEFPLEENPREAEASPDEACHRWRDRSEAGYGRERGRYPYRRHPSARRIAPALIAIGGIALLIAIVSHFFYFILGAAVLVVLFYLYRDHHGGMWEMHPRTPSTPEQ